MRCVRSAYAEKAELHGWDRLWDVDARLARCNAHDGTEEVARLTLFGTDPPHVTAEGRAARLAERLVAPHIDGGEIGLA